MFKFPENTTRASWTRHIKNKMVFYNLPASALFRILRSPDRTEEGIAPGTIAAMKIVKHNINKTASTSGQRKQAETEIWIMYKANKKITRKDVDRGVGKLGTRIVPSRLTMISAWRYPGRTKAGERPAIPEGVLEELEAEGVL
jgi:hypothetical protein